MKNTVETAILDAAFQVVNERTISGTRMHLIAEKCGMAQSNLHYHFKTKRDLLVALLEHIQEYFSETRLEHMAQCEDSRRGQLYGFLEQKKHVILDEPEYDRVQNDYWCMGQVDPVINESIFKSYQIWRDHVSDTILKYDPDLDPARVKQAAYVMISMMVGASFQYLCGGGFDLDTYNEDCLNMIEAYLDAAKSAAETAEE